MNIILCGLPKCGKTTLGKRVAKTLNWDFIDTDQWIEKSHGSQLSCREIYLLFGEKVFREVESQIIASLQNITGAVIALGGGSLCIPENAEILQKIGTIIYLKMPLDMLWSRVISQGIPAYLEHENPKKSFQDLEKIRLPIFERYSNVEIDVKYLKKKEMIQAIINYRDYGK